MGENGIAYYYCERFSGDWVARYCDFEKSEPKEIFRYKNENADIYPQAIISDGNNIAIVMQHHSLNGISSTVLQWINPEGDLLENEEIPLGEVFGQRKYEIISAHIIGDYYCFTADNCKLPNTAVFRRDGDTFYPMSMGDYLLGYDMGCCNGSAITFGIAYESFDPNHTEKLCGAVKVDFTNKSLTVCEIPATAQEDSSGSQNCYITPNDKLLTIFQDENAGYKYAVVG